MKKLDDLLGQLGTLSKSVWIKKYIVAGIVKAKLVGGNYYLEDNEYSRILRLRRITAGYDINIPEGYITRIEALEDYKIPAGYLITKDSANYIVIDRSKFYKWEYINNYINQRKIINNFIENGEWIKVSQVKEYDLHRKLIMYRKNNQLKKENYKDFDLGNHVEICVKKTFLDEIINGFKIETKRRPTYEKRYLLLKDIDKIICKMVSTKIENKQKRGKVLLDKVLCTLQIERKDINLIAKEYNIKNYIIIFEKKEYISLDMLEIIMNTNGFYSVHKMARIANVAYSIFQRKVQLLINEYASEMYKIEDREFLQLKLHRILLKEYSKSTLVRIKDDYEFLEKRLEFFNLQFIETSKATRKFLIMQLEAFKKSPHKNLRRDFNRNVSAIEYINNRIDKEIYNCTNEELINLVLMAQRGYIPIICKYINFCKKQFADKAIYNKEFGITMLKQYRINDQESMDEEIYEAEIWAKYYMELKNVDNHISKSTQDYRYAQVWLYCLLNLFLTWRKANLLLSMPNIVLEEIGIYNFEWFANNKFTITIANQVIEQMKFSLDGIVAFKNKRNLHFSIPISLRIPTAISIIICEIHRRINKKEDIFYDLIRRDPNINDYKSMFNNSQELYGFSNLKCTRSVMTYGYSNAVTKVGSSKVAYDMSTQARSHAKSCDKLSNITYEYLRLDTLEGGAKEYAYNIMERGSFGFLYYKILQSITGQSDINKYTINDVTDLINVAKENISPITIENSAEMLISNNKVYMQQLNDLKWASIVNNIKTNKADIKEKDLDDIVIQLYKDKAKEILESDFMESYIDKRYAIICDVVNTLKKEHYDFRDLIKKIYTGSNKCYTEYTNCVFEEIERNEKCIYRKKGQGIECCLGCKYNLPRTYALYEIATRLNNILDNIDKTNTTSENLLKLNNHVLKLYLSLLLEAKTSFNKYGNYVDEIVNLKEIKGKIFKLRSENKLIR